MRLEDLLELMHRFRVPEIAEEFTSLCCVHPERPSEVWPFPQELPFCSHYISSREGGGSVGK
jgi:hypothetical protein